MSGDVEQHESVVAPQQGEPTAAPARYYGFSVLVSGFAKMWRALLPALLIIVVNAAAQAALVGNNPVAGSGWVFWVQAAASALMLLVTGAVLAAAALATLDGWVSPGRAFAAARTHFVGYAVWVVAQSALVGIGLAFYTLPGWVLWGLTVFVPLAAIDGRRNAIGANFRAIGAHPLRWLVTWIVVSMLALLGWLAAGANTFLVGGWQAAAIANLVGGVAAWWLLTSWACLYRSRG